MGPSPNPATSLTDPRPKLSPDLIEQLKKEKHERRRARILLDLKDKESLERVKQKVEEKGGEVKEAYDTGNIVVVEMDADNVEALAEQEDINEIAPEREYRIFLQDRIPALGVDEAWNHNYTGNGTRIAILDTGIATHDNLTIAKGKSFVEGEDAADNNGHGTHVAGITQGIAPDALLYNAKVLDAHGGGTTSQIIAGINWALNPDGDDTTDDGADIISMSFGGTFTELDGPLASAVKDAIEDGAIFIVASGNCRQGCGGFYGVTTPGNVKEVITVGSVDNNNIVAGFSSGDTFDGYVKPDIVAPGVDITSTWLQNGHNTLSGTSMSTPFASGITALLLEKEGKLSHAEVKAQLTSTAADKGEEGWDDEYGAGLVDLSNLFALSPPNQTTTTPNESDTSHNYTDTPDFNSTILLEEERSSYLRRVVTTWNGDNATITYYFNATRNDSRYQDQMVLPSPVDPSSTVTATIELWEDLPSSIHPATLKLIISHQSGPTENIIWDSLDSRVIDALHNNIYIAVDIDFTAPSDHGDYHALARILDTSGSTIAYPGPGDWIGDWFDPNGLDFEVRDISGPVACYDDGDCPPDEWRDQPFCQNGAVYQDYRDYFCRNAGSPQSWCDWRIYEREKEVCSNTCSNGECVDTCTEGYTGSRRCSGDTVQREYQYTDCTTDWRDDQTCDGAYTCSTGACELKSCTDFGLQWGSCDTLGEQKRDGDYVVECQETFNPLSCWTPVSSNGDSDWCSALTSIGLACNRQEYDCDRDSHCASSLVCDGPLGDFTPDEYDGCCEADETWDPVNKQCVGQPCQLTSAYWVPSGTVQEGHVMQLIAEATGSCDGKRATYDIFEVDIGADDHVEQITSPPYNGQFAITWTAVHDYELTGDPEFIFQTRVDGSLAQSNELHVTPEPQPTGSSCTSHNECQTGYCHTDNTCKEACVDNDNDGYGASGYGCTESDTLRDCRDTNANVNPGAAEVCDNDIDDNCNGQVDENCVGELKVISINSAPTSVDQGERVQLRATIKNVGNAKEELSLEAGIVPEYWAGTIYPQYQSQHYWSISKCCQGNDYYDAKRITLDGGEQETVTFTLNAPTIHSTDTCGSDPAFSSAWDDQHRLFVGLYNTCGGGYEHYDSRPITVKEKVCYTPSDCNLAIEICQHIDPVTGGTCQPKQCDNECDPGEATCTENHVLHCEQTNGCYQWSTVEACSTGYTCENAACVRASADAHLEIEEAGTNPVIKQPGDILTVNIRTNNPGTVTLEYNKNAFKALNCNSATLSITQDKTCRFEIRADSGSHWFGLQGSNSQQVTITEPRGIILTNKEKLHQRYPGQNDEVNSLLQRTYSYANQHTLALYDLGQYIATPHPWGALSDYRERWDNPRMKDNTYPLEIGKFVRDKCQPPECTATVILGDDFVVPHYRRDVQFLNSFLFFDNPETNTIYSEIPYINRAEKPFSEFDELFYYKGDYDGKPFVIIKPDTMNAQLEHQLEELKGTLVDKFNPDIEELPASDVFCDDSTFFSQFNGATLLVFGTEQNNQAYNCFPFVAGLENRDSAFIEVNPWDGNNHAIVFNTEDTAAVEAFQGFIQTTAYKHVQSKKLYFIDTGLTIGSIATAFVGLDTAVDLVDAGFQCLVMQNKVLCGASSASLVLPIVPSGAVKAAIKSITNTIGPAGAKFLAKYGSGGALFIGKNLDKVDDFKVFFKKGTDYFGSKWDDISTIHFKRPADELDFSRGIKNTFQEGNVNRIEDFKIVKEDVIDGQEEVLADGFRALGDIEDVPGSKKIAKGFVKQNNIGPLFEAKRGSMIKKQANTKLLELDKDVWLTYTYKGQLKKNVKFDLDNIHEVTHGGRTTRVIEEVKSADLLRLDRHADEQLVKLSQAIKDGYGDQARVVIKGVATPELKNRASSLGIEILERGVV